MELKIGEVARLSGLTIDAVRFYERLGLLGRVRRTRGGQRSYDRDVLRRLAFIQPATALGFSLDEIRALFAARPGRVSALLSVIDARLADLRWLKRELERIATHDSSDE